MRLRFILFAALLAIPHMAFALEGPTQTTEYLTANLIAGGDRVAIDIQLKPEWHSYWRMPGEGGLPPKFDWSGSRNLKSATIQWPLARRFEQQGMYSFGYDGEVVLPVDIRPATPGQPVKLVLKAEMMVCKDICIPQKLDLALDLPAKAPPADPRIAQALKAVPHDGDLGNLRIDSAIIGPKALVIRAFSQNGFKDADLFAEVKDGAFYFTAPPVVTPDAKDPRRATIALAPPPDTGNLADGLMHHKVTLTLTLKDGPAIEKTIDF